MPENFDLLLIKQIEALSSDQRPSVLLHSCCGPCSSAVLQRLCPHFDVTIYFYNPNIMPKAEYDRRLAAQRKVLEHLPYSVPLIEGPYDTHRFLQKVSGLESCPERGERCKVCIEMRLEQTALYAKENNFDFFTTTLTVSPHKDAQFINIAAENIAKRIEVAALPADFKKKSGYLQSTKFCREHDIYRQSYCGCSFSLPKI